LPEKPPLRDRGEGVRTRVRSRLQRQPVEYPNAQQHRALDQRTRRPEGAVRIEGPLQVAHGQLEPTERQRALSKEGGAGAGEWVLTLTAQSCRGERRASKRMQPLRPNFPGREDNGQREQPPDPHGPAASIAAGSPACARSRTSARR